MALEEGDIVLCTVDRIVGTTVFVNIEGEDSEGSIITAEIAPGRIRNLRDYVIPKKKIVCKILRVQGKNIELSLRRVTSKEKKQVIDEYQQERSCASILRSVLGDKADNAIKEICKADKLSEFLEQSKENEKELEKLVGHENAKKILGILRTEKKKKAVVKKEFGLRTAKSNGLILIKELLEKIKDAEIKYLAAGKYSISTESTDLKKADQKLQEIIRELEKQAKHLGVEFSVKER